MMNFEETRNYWEERALADDSIQSTTQDVFLREIELNTLFERIREYSPKYVADVGCGDGRTTIGLALKFGEIQFGGFDYSSSMIENAKKVLTKQNVPNVRFEQHDICNSLRGTFDLIYTTRCLINLTSWDLQKNAIKNIHRALKDDGVYLMFENFREGQENFNRIRKKYELAEISIRDHNLFFTHKKLLDFTDDLFEVKEDVNISSIYYLVSRVIYSKICADLGTKPDYFDAHHRYAANLPFCGEYGPVRLISLRKK